MRKRQRLKKTDDIQKMFKEGKSFANRQFVVYVLEKKEQEEIRLGVSVSKKLGNAVKRNQIKRYIRQGIFELQPFLKQNADYMIIARPGATTCDFNATKKSLIHVLKIAKCLPQGTNTVR